MIREIQSALKSDKYSLSMESNRLGWLIPSDPNESIEILRKQFADQGYLWLKVLLNRDDVMTFRQRYFEAMAHTGLLKKDTSTVEGLYSYGDVNQQKIRRAQAELVRSSVYEAFCLSNEIWQFYERLLGDTVYLHKRKLVRHIPPQTTIATGAHYDLVYLRGGTDSVCSSWIPLGVFLLRWVDLSIWKTPIISDVKWRQNFRENEWICLKKNKLVPIINIWIRRGG